MIPLPRSMQTLVLTGSFAACLMLSSAAFALSGTETEVEAVSATEQTETEVEAVSATEQTETEVEAVSAAEQEDAIRWVLVQGVESGIRTYGKKDGIYGDPRTRIPMPEQFRKGEKLVRRMGGGKYADAFILALNRTAENALSEGGPAIIEMVREMPIEDRQSLINGSNGAIGNQFHSQAASVLLARFSPFIAKHADKLGLLSTLDTMLEKARFVKLVHETKVQIDRYIFGFIIEYLAGAVMRQEHLVKSDLADRASPLIRKVFGNY